MPVYDFRCENCAARFSLRYKTYASYDRATPSCPECGAASLSRSITGLAIAKASSQRDYSKMSSKEMLSVLESGDKRQVDTMFRQVGAPAGDKPSGG